MKNDRLSGMTAFVTGGGGGKDGGIGSGIARWLAREGARVVINDLSEDHAMATVKQLQDMGTEADAAVGNVSDAVQVKEMIMATVKKFGSLEIIVNNAGIGGDRNTIEHTSDEEWLRVIAVNLHGPFYMSRTVIPVMKKQGYGRIINIASIAAIRCSYLGGACYTASKSGLVGLTRHLATELAQYGITANAIMPGLTVTPLVKATVSQASLNELSKGIPALSLGEPEEIGALAAFLASKEAQYINGAAIPIDGALSILPGDFSNYRTKSGKEVS